MYILPASVEVRVDEEDLKSPPRIVCDVLISDTEFKVLISSYLAGELSIIAEDFKQGLWRLRNDPREKLRQSYPPQR